MGSKPLVWVRSAWGRLNAFLDKRGTHHWFNAISGVVAIASGALASFFSTEIRTALPYPICWAGHCGPGSVEASWFWGCVIVAAVMFAKNKKAESHQHNAAIAEIGNQSLQLRNAVRDIRTLPDDDFMSRLGSFSEQSTNIAARVFTKYLPMKNRDPVELVHEIDTTCRHVMKMIAALAIAYDGSDNADVIYGANVMIPRNREDVDTARSYVSITRGSPTWHSHRRYLDLILELSTRTDIDLRANDGQIGPLSLPLPDELQEVECQGGKKKTLYLPGAVHCYLSNAFVNFCNLKEIRGSFEDDCGLDEQTKSEHLRYFEEHKTVIQSFACIPLALPSSNGNEPRVIGTLNIHSNKEDILRAGRDPEIWRFLMISQSLISTLTHLVYLRAEMSRPSERDGV